MRMRRHRLTLAPSAAGADAGTATAAAEPMEDDAPTSSPTPSAPSATAVKVLSLAAFVVTLRLAQKVHRSRAHMLARSPLEPGRVPGDAKVLRYHYAAHLAIFLLILALNGEAMAVEQHVALLQDLFSHEYRNAKRAVFSNAWDMAVPAGAVLLGIVVFVQQWWNYAIVSRMGMAEQRKLQHIF